MAFFLKNTNDYGAAPDTAWNATVGNTTAAPGFTDGVPVFYALAGRVRVQSNVLRCNTEAGDGGNDFMIDNIYARSAVKLNQQIVVEYIHGSSDDSAFFMLRTAISASDGAGLLWNFPAGTYYFVASGGARGSNVWNAAGSRVSPTYTGLSLTVGKKYRITLSLDGSVFSLQVFNVTDNVAVTLSGGVTTLTYNASGDSIYATAGGFAIRAYNGGFGINITKSQYYDDETPTTPTGTYSQSGGTDTTAVVSATVSGGSAPYTVNCRDSSNAHWPGSPATISSSGGTATFTKTGLTPSYHYIATITGTDSASTALNSSGVNVVTEPAGTPTSFHVLGVGDSITVGGASSSSPIYPGTGQPVTIMANIVKEFLGLAVGNTSSATVAQSGYTSEQIASLITTDIVPLCNGTGGTANTGALTAPATCVVIRLGKNDAPVGPETNAQAAVRTRDSVQSIITAIKTNCPTVKAIIVEPITGYTGAGAEGPLSDDRQWLTNELFRALEDLSGACKVYTATRLPWYAFIYDPTKIPDTVHPSNPLGVHMLGMEQAMTYLYRHVLSEGVGGLAGLSSTDVTNIANGVWTATSRTLQP